jgi:hypothetical protein
MLSAPDSGTYQPLIWRGALNCEHNTERQPDLYHTVQHQGCGSVCPECKDDDVAAADEGELVALQPVHDRVSTPDHAA